ncbi:carbamoyltransferase HypF [Moorella naiadis]|uniref:carbamoyltransferase HypF n=1 Tax=Moorella naiadis (nom. illeg.) TaxID=3093670 RepID=UPI003D9C8E40
MAPATGSLEKSPNQPLRRYRLTVQGIVQGVGFRPFVYRLAQAQGIRGEVYNASNGVCIDAEGEADQVAGFFREILARPPCLARISSWQQEELPPCGRQDFTIKTSLAGAEQKVVASPDVALCPDCRREVLDPADRHYRYPFTNCTCCGPRFTIIYTLPYDRARTAMAPFELCPDCAAEYATPADRRFHAQPVACPICGPQVMLLNKEGRPVAGDWLERAAFFLRQGHILAIKGVGGFHLAVDASNNRAVANLRRRKARPAKPFAVMARDLATVAKYCLLRGEEAQLLTAPAAPIVLLRQRAATDLAPEVAPGLPTLGVMLPYTPLHLLLLREGPPLLVMTSANRSDLPLIKDDGAALQELAGVADYFLSHNRAIVNRCDDSVVAWRQGDTHFYRRSRGYVPAALPLDLPDGPDVLAAGGDLKNTFCLLKGQEAFLSQHIGDLATVETQAAWREARERLQLLTGCLPQIIACDLHPAYYSTRLAWELGAQVIGVQHHHAHLAGCLAENGANGPVLGIIGDGTGYGPDGAIWGGEILLGSYSDYQRLCHLRYVPLPGGDQGARHPWYMAISYLYQYLGPTAGARAAREIFTSGGQQATALDIVLQMLRRGFNLTPTSSLGRLFDAVAALCGLCLENTYDGQAAILLEEAALAAGGHRLGQVPYPFTLTATTMDPGPMLPALCRDLQNRVAVPVIAARFHQTLVAMIVAAVQQAAAATGIRAVALSGGVWHNTLLLAGVSRELRQKGFTVYRHRLVPPNDGGLALGQAVIARATSQGYC